MDSVVEPCGSCRRHVRSSETVCPFCGEPFAPGPRPAPPRAPTRAALAAWAGLFAACGGPQSTTEVQTQGSEGTEQTVEQDVAQEEVSCAGRCGSHHHPPCMDDPDPCPAPPYGTPPSDEAYV